MRGDPKHFVASKVMCWVAVDRGLRIARVRDDSQHIERWEKAANDMRAEILSRGVDDRGVFVQHYDTKDLDASNLLIPIMGFLPGDDERVRATVLASPTADQDGPCPIPRRLHDGLREEGTC
jgi:GH15 family glucan-1,4-alpha-glucosidase